MTKLPFCHILTFGITFVKKLTKTIKTTKYNMKTIKTIGNYKSAPYANYPNANNTKLSNVQFRNRMNMVKNINNDVSKKNTGWYVLWSVVTAAVGTGGYFLCKKIKQHFKTKHEDKTLENKKDLLTHKTNEQIRLAQEKEKIRQSREKNAVITENPETWDRPCDKYIAAYRNKKSNISTTEDIAYLSNKKVFGDFIHEGEIAILFSGAGVGKSQLSMDIAHAIAEGKPIHALSDKAHIQMPVLYMSSEDMRSPFNTRYNGHWPNNLEYLNFCHYETAEECLDVICEKMESINSSCLIIIDSITSIFDKKISPNKVLFFVNILKVMQQEFAKNNKYLTFLITSHTASESENKKKVDCSEMSGGINWHRLADSNMALTKNPDNGYRYLESKKRRNREDDHLTYVMKLQKNPHLHFQYVKTLGDEKNKKGGKVYRPEADKMKRLAANGLSISEIANKMGRDPKTVKKILNKTIPLKLESSQHEQTTA